MSDLQTPDFWDERYRNETTPWDYGGVPPEFHRYLRSHAGPLRILIPGCGKAHEVRTALALGHDPTGIDISREAVRRARSSSGAGESHILHGDFFTHPFSPGTFDLIYERTFLCAIPPAMRPIYVERMHALLKPGGTLLGYFFHGLEPDPPPYPLEPDEDRALFGARFKEIASAPSEAPLPFFGEAERWQIWQRME